jgi:inorganic triphosphatase YgiF
MSAVAKELELKLQASPECLDRFRYHPDFRDTLTGPLSEQTLISVYFDSDDFYLRNHGINLRVRQVGDRHLQTIKVNEPGAPYFERAEIENEVPGNVPNLEIATECALIPPIAHEVRNHLKPVFETQVERQLFRLGGTDSEIEVALDRGRIRANGSELPISEIELELKRGNPADLFNLARSISAVVPVQLAVESKAERGYELLNQSDKEAAKAEPIVLAPSFSVAEAFKAIAHSCLRQIAANTTAVLSHSPDALHQMRVGMRRLRAAIWVFSEILRDDQTEQIKSKLKYYANELAPARDLEVMIVDVLRPFSRRYPKEKGFASLIRSFSRRRKQAYDRAIQAITSGEFRTFTIDCSAWIEAGDWSAPKISSASEALSRTIDIYAALQIARQRKKLLRRGRHLASLEPDQVHELRIRAKKLRYTTEFFRSLYADGKESKRLKRFVSEMQGLQDALGSYNDMTVRRKLFVEFTAGTQAKRNPQVAFAAGQIVGEQHAFRRQLLKDAAKALSRFGDVKSFWKVRQHEPNGMSSAQSQDVLQSPELSPSNADAN